MVFLSHVYEKSIDIQVLQFGHQGGFIKATPIILQNTRVRMHPGVGVNVW